MVKTNKTKNPGDRASFSSRRSGRAKLIGDKGEQIVVEWLRGQANTDREREKIVWVAAQGETPGWDIEDRRFGSKHVVYEVKATNGTRFPAIEVTANEWRAAEQFRKRYNFVLVAECESNCPRLQVINNPWSLFERELLSLVPTIFRLERA